ncbi:hypothetical protein HPB47_000854, partial [Ixodes persulcatus]
WGTSQCPGRHTDGGAGKPRRGPALLSRTGAPGSTDNGGVTGIGSARARTVGEPGPPLRGRRGSGTTPSFPTRSRPTLA